MKGLIFLPIIALTLFSCQKTISFKQEQNNFKSSESEEDNEGKVKAYETILSTFVQKYQKTVNEYRIRPLFYDSLSLMIDKNISANFYLSSLEGSVIEVFFDPGNRLSIYSSDYPVQTMIFDSTEFYQNSYEVFKLYRQYKGKIDLSGKYNIGISSESLGDSIATTLMVLNLVVGKVFDLDSSTFVYINNLRYELIYNDHKKIFFSKHKGVTILAGSRDVSRYDSNAKFLGKLFADTEVQNRYVRSEYFREILAEDKLRPRALEIVKKVDHKNHDPNFPYGPVEFSRDREDLQKTIDSFNIKLKTDVLFADAKSGLRSGTLWRYYSSYEDYSIQWILANGAYGLLILFLMIFKILPKKEPFNKKAVFGFLITVNGYCFVQRPADMPIEYWYPSLIILIVGYFMYYHKWKKIRP
jgi:hypothetical protein